MQNVFTLPFWGRWHDFGVTDEVVVYSGRQGSVAKPRVLNDSLNDCQTPRCPSPQNKTKELRQFDAVLAIIKNQSKLKVTSPSFSTNFALKRLPFLDTKSVSSAVDPVARRRAASAIGISRRQMLTPILKLQPSE